VTEVCAYLEPGAPAVIGVDGPKHAHPQLIHRHPQLVQSFPLPVGWDGPPRVPTPYGGMSHITHGYTSPPIQKIR
jgi:hypothetical protein